MLDKNDVLHSIAKYKKTIIIFFILSFFVSTIFTAVLPKKHYAVMTVSPAVMDLKEQYKNKQDKVDKEELASDFDKFLYLLTSMDVVNVLIDDNYINDNIDNNSSISNLLLYNSWNIDAKTNLVNFLQKNIIIKRVEDTSIKQIVLKHKNPKFAEYLLGRLYKVSDDLIKQKEKAKNEHQIEFIQDYLKQNTISDNKQVFLELLKQQLQIKSMLDADMLYSAEIIENINVSSYPVYYPCILIILIGTCLLGLLFSCVFIYFKEN